MEKQVILAVAIGILTFQCRAAETGSRALDLKNSQPKVEVIPTLDAKDLTPEAKEAWLQETKKKCIIVQRAKGPFGLPQDLAKILVKTKLKRRAPNAFLNAIGALKVNAVLPSDNMFIIGSREFKAGSHFPLIRNNQRFEVEIVSVSSVRILFRDMGTGEEIKKNLNSLPAGISRQIQIESIPGIVPERQSSSAPLILDSEPTTLTKQ